MNDHQDLVIEKVLDAPRDLVWKAWATPELLRQWWAPRPYRTPECELELRPGGKFYTRMTGPDGFDASGTGCFLEVIAGERIVWTSALLPDFRPAAAIEDCGGFPFTALVTLADADGGRTLYRAVAMHRSEADREVHANMGFVEGWGKCADQLGEVAAGLRENA